jgi:hypothetical protein
MAGKNRLVTPVLAFSRQNRGSNVQKLAPGTVD